MQTFKKVTVSIIAFLGVLVFSSGIIFEPMIQFGWQYYCDGKYREQTAGEYEMLFIGDSDGLTAFKPSLFYEQTGIKAYNISAEKNTFYSEYYLLKKELERNPVKDVIIQVGMGSFSTDYSEEHAGGDMVAVIRTPNVLERFRFLISDVEFDSWLDIYSQMLMRGVLSWKGKLTGDKSSFFYQESKGWHRVEATDCSLSPEEVNETFNSEVFNDVFLPERVEEWESMIELAKSHGANVRIVIVPMTDGYLWMHENCDEISERIAMLCQENEVIFTDINLLKSRFELFHDNTSFKDSVHLCETGADVFTSLMANYYNKNSMEERVLSNDFYETYEQMKLDSPYMKYIYG